MSQFRSNNPVRPPRWERAAVAGFVMYTVVVVGVVSGFIGYFVGLVVAR
jgi:hypothetical protein